MSWDASELILRSYGGDILGLDCSANRGCGCSRKRCDLQCTWAGPGEEHQNGPSIATELECQSRLLLSLTFSIK